MQKNWISGAIEPSHRGALHRALGVPEGQKIPPGKMAQAKSSDNPKVRRMAALAKTLRGFKKKAPSDNDGDEG